MGRIFLTLFGLPFFGVGLWAAYSVGSTLFDAWRMAEWPAVEARLESGGYQSSGGDSDTGKAYAQYTYVYDGQIYSGDRVSIESTSDNIGDYQQDIGNNLRQAVGKVLFVYVDPNAPDQSIIDRGVRWGMIGFKMIFVIVFGGVGLLLMIAAWRKTDDKDPESAEVLAEPWTAKEEWQSATMRSSSKAAMWGAWGFAVFWNAISSPLLFILPQEVLEKQNYAALLGLLFPLVGVGLLVWAIRRTREWRRFGPAPLTLDPYPGSIGGHVGGTIELAIPFDQNRTFQVVLTCLHSYVSGSGKNRSRKEKAEWQETTVAHADMGANGTRLTFRFDVPEGLRESDIKKDDSYYKWQLNLSCDLSGVNLDRDYEIPVFATATQSRRLSQLAVEKGQQKQQSADDAAVREYSNLQVTPTGKRLFFPMGRMLGGGLGGFLIGAIFVGVAWFLIVKEDHTVMGSVFGLVGGLIAMACFWMFTNSLEVVQSAAEIRTVRRWFGIPVKRRSMQRSAFKRFARDSNMRSSSGSKHTVYYSIHAIDNSGSKLIVGEGYKGKNEADAAIRLLNQEFGLVEAANDSVAQSGSDGYGPDVFASD